MEKLKQLFKSRTFWGAIILSLLTMAELQFELIAQFIPPESRPWLLAIWPTAMLFFRMITTTALSDK